MIAATSSSREKGVLYDFLVNIYEDAPERPEARRRMAESAASKVFRTKNGLEMLRSQFLS